MPTHVEPLKGLKARREFAKLTTYDMAPVIGVSQSVYSKIENGRVPLCIHRAVKLADKLQCRLEELL